MNKFNFSNEAHKATIMLESNFDVVLEGINEISKTHEIPTNMVDVIALTIEKLQLIKNELENYKNI